MATEDEGKSMFSLENDWVHDSPYGHLHLRDFFAAFALAGLSHEHLTPSEAAKTAYARADAMLTQREAAKTEAG